MMRSTLLALSVVGIATAATAQTWKENLAAGAATTKRNHQNVPFTMPTNKQPSVYTNPINFPIYDNRGPIDRSPKGKGAKVLVMGTGGPKS